MSEPDDAEHPAKPAPPHAGEPAQRARIGAIGLDVGATALNLVQFRQSASGPRWQAAASLPLGRPRDELLADPEALAAMLQKARARAPLAGNRVVSALPPNRVRILPVSCPAGQDAGGTAALAGSLAGRLEGDLQDYVIDRIPVRGPSGDRHRVLVVAALRADVRAHLDLLSDAGLEPLALEINPAAIRRLVGGLSRQHDNAGILAVNFGRHWSYLSVISGRRLLLDRAIACGEQLFVDEIAGALELAPAAARELARRQGIAARDPAATRMAQTLGGIVTPLLQPLADEIRHAALRGFAGDGGARVDRLLLLGSLARWPGFGEALSRSLRRPVDTLGDLLGTVAGTSDAEAGNVGMAVAAGLALRGLVSDWQRPDSAEGP